MLLPDPQVTPKAGHETAVRTRQARCLKIYVYASMADSAERITDDLCFLYSTSIITLNF